MAAVDDIVVNVVLSGNQDVAAFFNSIREAGEKGFIGIDAAANRSTSALGGLVTAIGAVGAAFTAAGVGAFAFVTSMSEVVDSIGDLSTQTGVATEEISGLKAAFAEGGVAPHELEQAFRKLSVSVAQSWSEIKKAVRDGADQAASGSLAVVSANQQLTESLRNVANEERDFADQRRQNTLGLVSAEQSLQSARLAERRLRGEDTSFAEQQLQKQQARLATQRAQIDVQQAQRRIAEQAQKEEDQRVKDAVQARQAELSLRQAERKEDDDRKNSVTNAIDAVKRLGEGNKDALKDINATPENLAKGIIGAAKLSENAIKQFDGDINQLAGAGPGVLSVFKEMGTALSKIEDPALRAAVAARLLGKAVSQDLLQIFSDPSQIERFTQRLKDLGLATNSLDTSAANNFRSALFTLQNDIGQVGQKISTGLAPAFTKVLENIDDFVVDSKDKMIEWAENVGTSVEKYLEALDRVREGKATPEDQWLVDLVQQFDDLRQGVTGVVDVIVSLSSQLQDANKSFKDLTGVDLLGILNPFSRLLDLLKAVSFVLNAITDSFNLLNKAAGGTVDASALKGAEDRLKAIKDFFSLSSEERKKAAEDYNKANADQQKRDKEAADAKEAAAKEERKNAKAIADEESKVAGAAQTSGQQRVQAAQQVLAAEKQVTAEREKQNSVGSGTPSDNRARTEQLKQEVRESAAAARQSVQQINPNDFIDQNGIRNIIPQGGGGIVPTLANQIAQAAAQALGVDPSQVRLGDGSSFGSANPVRGGTPGRRIDVPSRQPGSLEDFERLQERNRSENLDERQQAERFARNVAREMGRELGDFDPSRPRRVQPGFEPPELGRLDENGNFIPNERQPFPRQRRAPFISDSPFDPREQTFDPTGNGISQPFGHNGQPAPLSFPDATRRLRDALESLASPEEVARERRGQIPLGPLEEQQRQDDFGQGGFEQTPEDIKTAQREAAQAMQEFSQGLERLTSQLTQQSENPQQGEQVNSIEQFMSKLDELLGKIGEKVNNEQGDGSNVGEELKQAAQAATETASAFDAIDQAAASLQTAMNEAASAAQSFSQSLASASVGGLGEAAEGGLLIGPSHARGGIHIEAEGGEYVHRRAATSFWGTQFMRAVNHMDVAGVFSRLPRLETGGLISNVLPRFADGGMVSKEVMATGSPMKHLGVVDLRTTDNPKDNVRVFVDQNGAEQLSRLATTRRITSTTKNKPGFVR